jgi:peptidoglycan/LPS O-acetylase OafA/YrhL
LLKAASLDRFPCSQVLRHLRVGVGSRQWRFQSPPPFESSRPALYNFPTEVSMTDAASNPLPGAKPRRTTILAAGLLLLALALVVIYTERVAFRSPIALVVVAAIGLAALLLQLRLRQDRSPSVRAPLWLNVLGVISAIAAVVADVLRFNFTVLLATALGAVVCFAVSGVIVLDALRKTPPASK